MRFIPVEEAVAGPPTGLLGLGLEKTDLLSLAQSAILAIVVLLALMLVLRPMAMRLSTVQPGALLPGQFARLDGSPATQDGGGGPGAATSGPALLADESMVNMMNIEGQIRASSIRKLADLVQKHPEESLTIMRGWMTQEHS